MATNTKFILYVAMVVALCVHAIALLRILHKAMGTDAFKICFIIGNFNVAIVVNCQSIIPVVDDHRIALVAGIAKE